MYGPPPKAGVVSSYSKRTRASEATGRWAAAALILLSSCSAPAPPDDGRLGSLLPPSVADGYELVEPPASGPMDLDTASTATSATPAALRGQLGRTGFRGGHARIWRRTADDFVGLLLFELADGRRAAELVAFMDAHHREKPSAQRFTPEGIPGAAGVALNARAPGSGRSLFCQIVWFAHRSLAVEARTCQGRPASVDRVVGLARLELGLLRAQD